MLFDTHCHFDVSAFDVDRNEVAARAHLVGVESVLVPGCQASEWATLLQVCENVSAPHLFPALGLHPCYSDQHEELHLRWLEHYLQERPDIVAVGEIGLDFYLPALKEQSLKEKQGYFFKQQLQIAQQFNKPVILHIRKAHQEVLRYLHDVKFREGGIAHAYSGGIEEAKHLLRLGFRLGVGGAATYDQAHRLRRLINELPLASFVLETDAPDMIPRAYRQDTGINRNSPEYLPAVAEAVAQIKNMAVTSVIKETKQQAYAVLKIHEKGELNGGLS